MVVKMFKAKKQTKRFKKNQKVWVTYDSANHVFIRFKWRGNGRYVNGVIDKWNWSETLVWNKVIGEEGFQGIEIDDAFAEQLLKDHKNSIDNNTI